MVRNRPRPRIRSSGMPSKYSEIMLVAMWIRLPCRNPAVSSRQYSPDATSAGIRPPCRYSVGQRQIHRRPRLHRGHQEERQVDADQHHRDDRLLAEPRAGDRARRRWSPPAASATQARQWKPTLAGVRHSGQAGRPQRVQVSAVARSGCQRARQPSAARVPGRPAAGTAAAVLTCDLRSTCAGAIGRLAVRPGRCGCRRGSSMLIELITTSSAGRSKRSVVVLVDARRRRRGTPGRRPHRRWCA